jgi:hypothetical protein
VPACENVSVATAPTERLPAVGPGPPAAAPVPGRRGKTRRARRGASVLWWPTLLIAGALCFVTFYAKGGLNLESMTMTEVALTLAAGLLVAGTVVLGRRGGYGLWSTGLLLAFSALTAISVVWSVAPDASWQDTGRMFAYSGVFAAAVALARVAPDRWPAVIGGLTLAAVAVCGYALLTKVFPASLDPSNTYARLEAPYGYWNAIGLTAAMGAIGCMWLGARRSGHALLNALAYPAMGVLLLTLVLAYSRGALAALLVGLALWFCIVPLRLRGAALLILAGLAAGAVGAWDFSRHALSSDRVALFERTAAGHELGALLAAMLLLLALAGIAIGFFTGRRAPARASRTRAGATLLALIAIAAIAFAGALAHSHRGFSGSISHAVDSLTNPNARTPPNTPDRLTAAASVRARYWKEALQVYDAHPALGAGAMGYQTARLRYRTEPLVVTHAHGFLVQTLADLGLVGLFLALVLLLSWMTAAGRATHPFNRRWSDWQAWRRIGSRTGAAPGWRPLAGASADYTPERLGLLSMLCVVVVFGMHSLIDWTWYVPGNACAALVCAGWLAGRGPLADTIGERAATAAGPAGSGVPTAHTYRDPAFRLPRSLSELGYARACVAVAVIAVAVLAVWSESQPLRSEDSVNRADALLAHDPAGALAAANQAVARDPLSPLALFTLAEVQQVSGHTALARATLQRAVREQPSNPKTWVALGRFDVTRNPEAAVHELQAAIYLNPESVAPELLTAEHPEAEAIAIYNSYVEALRSAATASALRTASARHAREAAAARRAHRPRSGHRPARSGTPGSAG